ncbi:ribonuclease P protein subunit [Candidatus Woesearchaeota archaeon]|nr:ribonuclease P protein subunit [Candidatus Woesearchaeota archaeon]
MKIRMFPFELIGQEVEIVASTNPSHIGVKGKVIDETKATLIIEEGVKPKTFLKNNVTFKICKNGKIIVGSTISKRPEDRIKG